ncbi:trimeric intracellular cation channel family protein [Novosphingobium terrae]|uniref:trimeric intracellular cation channel family protein n=1 Tax=Novosphingobium terrae TaxID=2726189 RepID=UPI00197E795E|nr:trimeric intracellular cation channel family protein [Novosphingobium terrae]
MSTKAAMVRGIVRTADIGATFVFAAEGALAGVAAGLDPVGLLVVAFLTGLGGGVLRDVLIAQGRPAAVADWHYSLVVIAAAMVAWLFHASLGKGALPLVVALDAAGLSLAAVAGTQKALEHQVHPIPAIFLGTLSGVGGGAMRDLVLNEVPRVLRADIYAVAAMVGALIVVCGRLTKLDPRIVAVAGGCACFALRMAAVHYGWNLPTALNR